MSRENYTGTYVTGEKIAINLWEHFLRISGSKLRIMEIKTVEVFKICKIRKLHGNSNINFVFFFFLIFSNVSILRQVELKYLRYYLCF